MKPARNYNQAEQVCGQAYQVVGVLLDELGLFNSEPGQKILDNLSQARLVHDDVLPFVLDGRPGHCTWEQKDELQNTYETLCGAERQLPRYLTPMMDGMSYCLFCGQPLVELLVSDRCVRNEENEDVAG